MTRPSADFADRLAALEAEHAKDRARIERLERLLAYTAREVAGILPFTFEPWAQALRDAMHDELAEIDRGKDPAAPVEEPLDTRKLTYDFLTLPSLVRRGIVQGLGLLTEDDRSLANDEAWKLAFRRAKERNLLDQLRAEIDRERGRT